MKAEKLVNPAQLVDELTYTNYAHNRRLSPHITPERWAKIYPNAEAMEARFTADAVKAQDMLRSAVEWHQQNEAEVLPTPLLAILCAARQVC